MIDYGAFTQTNRDLDTGIRYGLIALNDLNIFEELYALPNPREEEALVEYAREILTKKIDEGKVDFNDLDLDEEADPEGLQDALYAMTDEQVTDLLDSLFPNEKDRFYEGMDMDMVGAEGEVDGVSVRVTELGGAYHLWIFHSPFTGWYRPCSPCAPGAADLSFPVEDESEGVLGYDVPPSWREI